MPQFNNIHWTVDEELLERFVLHQLEMEVRSQLEAHLLECAECRQRIQAELQLAAGIRRAGREALKVRLRGRVQAQPRRAVSWYQVIGVAATVVLLITIGIHSRWFFRGETKQELVTEQTPKDARLSGGESKLVERDRAARVEKGGEEHRVASKSISEVGTTALLPKEKTPQDAALQPPKEPLAINVEEAKEAQAEHVELPAGEGAKKEVARPDRYAFAAETVWLEGTVLSSESTAPAAPQLLARGAEKQTEQLRVHKMHSRLSKSEQEKVFRDAEAEDAIVVEQRPVSALSPSQRAKQQVNAVQTELRRTDGALLMTLFLDPPVSERVLQDARIEQIREDSILVILGAQCIAYKLPPGWKGQFRRQVEPKD